MNRIGFLAEAIENPRLCVLPTTVKKLSGKFASEVLVERNIGKGLGINDSEFAEAGAQVVSREDVLHECDLLSFIEPPEEDVKRLDNKVLVGMMNPLNPMVSLDQYLYKNISVFSIDMVPRTSRTQVMDVLSSLSSIAGYKAVVKAAELYGSVFPMMSTAAGTLKPAKVLVLGAGVAGLQAIATAKRLGATVEAFDVREATATQVESLGATFIREEGSAENDQGRQAVLTERIATSDIVICTVNIPGKKAPVLISNEQVESMAMGSVIVDLASASGGNCERTEDGRLIVHKGVSILGAGHISKLAAYASTQMLAENYRAFLEYFLIHHAIANDEIIRSCKLIERGVPVHAMFKHSNEWKIVA